MQHQPVPTRRRPLSALAEAVAQVELVVVEEIRPRAALDSFVEEMRRPVVGMRPSLVRRRRRRVPRHYGHAVNGQTDFGGGRPWI